MDKIEAKSDEEIAEAVQNGDTAAFGILIDRYEKKISRYARKFLSNREDIEDVLQDVFIKIYQNIQGFDAKRRFSPWLYRIAHNELVNILRKKSREPLFLLDISNLFSHPWSRETADKEAIRKETAEIIDRCLSKLSAKYREPLILYYFEEMDYREIADILRLSVSTVGVRLSRAREKVREMREKEKF